MGPSRGDTICGEVVIEAVGPMHFGARALGPIHIARTPTEPRLWLSVVERTLLPKSADVSRFMAGVGELARIAIPGAVPLVLVDREADFCVVGYRAIDGAQTLAQIAERGPDEHAALALGGALARTLADFHRRGFVHGLVTASTVLRAGGTWWTWQYGIAGMCAPDRLAPRVRPLGGDPVAPELRAAAGISPASDVFGWGTAVACLLTGASGSDAINSMLEDDRDDPLHALVRACLDATPELRPRDGAMLLAKLQGLQRDASDTGEISFADLNDGLEEPVEDGSRFGLPGDPPGAAASRRPPPPPVGRAAPRAVARRDAPVDTTVEPDTREESVVELLVLGPDEGLEPDGRGGAAARTVDELSSEEITRLRALHGETAWREIAEHYLAEHPPTREEVEALPLQDLTPPPVPGDRRSGALGRVALIRTRVRTGPQKPVRPDVNVQSGTFEMSDDPEPEPRAPPRVVDDAPELPLGPDDDETPWDDAEAAVFDLDAADGPRRVDAADQTDEEVEIEWPADAPPLDLPRIGDGEARGRGGRLGLDEVTPPHATPLRWLEENGVAPETAPVLDDGVDHEAARLLDDGGVSSGRHARGAASREAVDGRAREERPTRRATSDEVRDLSGRHPDVPSIDAGRTATSTSRGGKAADAARAEPVVVGVVAPAAAVPTPIAQARRPRPGSGLALMFAALTGGIAIAMTLGLARHRGGVAQLLALEGAAAALDGDTTPEVEAAPVEPVPPGAIVEAPPVVEAPTTCPETMRAIDGRTCIDRGEFPGLSEIPRTQVDLKQAQTACAERGARLCTTQEWRRACKGPQGWKHPYGVRNELDRCNGAAPSGAIQDLSRSGARDTCVTAAGVFDLEGNVAEWVSDGAVLGGDSATRGPSCDTRVKLDAAARAATIGFRCCMGLGGV